MSEVEAILADIQGTVPKGPEPTVSLEHVSEDEQPTVTMKLDQKSLDQIQQQLDRLDQLESVKNFIIERGVISRSIAMESFAGMPFYTLSDKLVTKLTEQPSKMGLTLVTSDIEKYAETLSMQATERMEEYSLSLKRHIEIIDKKNVLDAIRFTLPCPRDEYGSDLLILCFSIIENFLPISAEFFYQTSWIEERLREQYTDGLSLSFDEDQQNRFITRLKEQCDRLRTMELNQSALNRLLAVVFAISLIYDIYTDIST